MHSMTAVATAVAVIVISNRLTVDGAAAFVTGTSAIDGKGLEIGLGTECGS